MEDVGEGAIKMHQALQNVSKGFFKYVNFPKTPTSSDVLEFAGCIKETATIKKLEKRVRTTTRDFAHISRKNNA